MEWITNNVQAAITLGVVVFGLIATWVMFGADIKQLKKDFLEMKIDSKKDRGEIKNELHELLTVLHAHIADTTLHIDPRRDEKRWDDFQGGIYRRFDGIEDDLKKLMIIHRPGPVL